MIDRFVKRFEGNKEKLVAVFSEKHPDSYMDIVRPIIEILGDDGDDYFYSYAPDPERIHEIDDGDYQGTLVYVIGAKGYQPSTYYVVKVDYGSCSGCDTLQAIREYSYDKKPSEEQVRDYMVLALHVVQNMKEV